MQWCYGYGVSTHSNRIAECILVLFTLANLHLNTAYAIARIHIIASNDLCCVVMLSYLPCLEWFRCNYFLKFIAVTCGKH